MKLLEQNDTNWTNIAPFLDSICLPVYRYQVEQKVLHLDEANLITYITNELEKRLTGRMLLLPATSVIGAADQSLTNMLDHIQKELSLSGFHYSFLVIIEENLGEIKKDESFHILTINKDADREVELERVYGQILTVWQSS